MVATQVLNGQNPSTNLPPNLSPGSDGRHFQIIEKTYQNNLDSDYTEKIETLGKEFDYASNSQHYWGDADHSILYGTPLYEQASESQKLALNHLYWVSMYQYTAAAESNTMLYNNITSGVFATVSGYDTLCQELDFETTQERHHIQTFQRIGYKTKIALLGKEALGNPLHKKQIANDSNPLAKAAKAAKALPKHQTAAWKALQESTFRATTKMLLADKSQHFSLFLKDADELPTATSGMAGSSASPATVKFIGLNWGSSPFLAAQYYSARMIANMSLKVYEHPYYKQFRDLQKENKFIPAPIAVSHYHLLDEAFHTTMSQVIAQDVYRDFQKPSVYEKLLANVAIYLLQRGFLSSLSGSMPATFRGDGAFMSSYYRLLTSPLFGLSSADALHWLEKCMCHEHQGFHSNLKFHHALSTELRRFFDRLEYLHPINREMRLVTAGASIENAVKRNTQAFEQFSRSIA
jgi:hypothetical protein